MLRSCSYCHRIHDTKHDCGMKPRLSKYKGTEIDKFRWTAAWKQKRDEIRERDLNLCQVCIRNLYNTVYQYNYDYLSVHHAIPIETDYDKRLDNDNLLTMCDYHHKCAERGEIPYAEIKKIIDEQEVPPEG